MCKDQESLFSNGKQILFKKKKKIHSTVRLCHVHSMSCTFLFGHEVLQHRFFSRLEIPVEFSVPLICFQVTFLLWTSILDCKRWETYNANISWLSDAKILYYRLKVVYNYLKLRFSSDSFTNTQFGRREVPIISLGIRGEKCTQVLVLPCI